MRVTNGMMVSTLRNNINRSLTSMAKLENQLATGRAISKPSDDPVKVSYALRVRNNLTETEQFTKNADDGLSMLDATDSALNEANSVMQRIRELTVEAATGTNNADSLEAIRKEVSALREHIRTITNTQFGDKYIFSGTMTNIPTYDSAEVRQGNTNTVNYEIGVGTTVPINITADQVFENGGTNIFQSLAGLETDLQSGDSAALSSRISDIDKWADQINNARSEVGARVNRLEFAKSRLEDTKVNLTGLLSKTEDADMAQLITEFKTRENVYEASLSAGAKIVQPTLIDFLR